MVKKGKEKESDGIIVQKINELSGKKRKRDVGVEEMRIEGGCQGRKLCQDLKSVSPIKFD